MQTNSIAPKKILIVDDIADNIVLLKCMLEFFSSDYQIYSAESGKEAMEQIVSILPDAIVLDIRMPDIDGFTICKWVRQNVSLPYIPILFLTAHAFSLDDKIKGFECGGDDYMTKPFEKDEFYVRIKSILKLKSLQDELYEKNKHLEFLLKNRTKALNESEIKYEALVEGAAEYEKQLIQADKMKSLGIMVSGVAHEINNPNNFILLNSQTLNEIFDKMLTVIDECYKNCKKFTVGSLSYPRTREKIPELLDGIVEGSTRIQRIVKQLKDFARTNISGYAQSVDINDVAEAAITITDNLIKKSTARFSVEYGNDIPLIKGNRQELEQVIINLLTNSCESVSDPDKPISVVTLYDELSCNVIVKVIDEGVGIPEDTIGKIFDPFYTTKRDSGGTGLGLSVSFNILKNHNGSLSFTSKPEEGTTALMKIPSTVNRKPLFPYANKIS